MQKNYQFIEIGRIHENSHGIILEMKADGKKRHETFENIEAALEQAQAKVKDIHKNSKVPVSIKYIRENGTLTWICYTADSKPKEYAAFDYLGFNTSSHKVHERRVYMTPRQITYNDIARTSAAEKVRDRRAKNIVDALLLGFWLALLAMMLKFSLAPSDAAKAASNQFGLEWNNPLAWASIVAGFVCVTAFLIADNVPRIIFWRKSREGIDGKSVRMKAYGESKDWRPFYRSRHFGNVWGLIFLALAFIFLVMGAIGFNSSVYFEFRLKLSGSLAMAVMFILAALLLAVELTLKVYGFMLSHARRELVLHKFVDEELRPYFKAWARYKGIKNEELKFHWDLFVYPQSKEELNKAYEAIKANMQLTPSENREIKKDLEAELAKVFGKEKPAKTEKPAKVKKEKSPKEEKQPKAEKPAKVKKEKSSKEEKPKAKKAKKKTA